MPGTDRSARCAAAHVASGVDAVAWDLDAGTIDTGALEGIAAVVHLAGVGIGDARWTDERKRLIAESRTGPTRLLAETLAASREAAGGARVGIGRRVLRQPR